MPTPLNPIYPAEIKARQRFLKSRGFDPGPIDGDWGPWSKKAELAYQESLDDTAVVRNLQDLLNVHGANPPLRVDGIYGPNTRAAELNYAGTLIADGQKPQPTSPPVQALGSGRAKVIQVAKSLVGTREKTNHNDGPVIDDILASCGLRGKKEPYCACFVVYVGDMAFGRALNPYPRSAWSPDMVERPTWQQGIGGKTPKPGDTFGIYFSSKGRVAHTGFIYEWTDGSPYCLTIEGNTGPSGSVGESDRNGDGIYLKRRMKSDIHSVRNWID